MQCRCKRADNTVIVGLQVSIGLRHTSRRLVLAAINLSMLNRQYQTVLSTRFVGPVICWFGKILWDLAA
jgi:hypothetical protein